MVLKLSADGEKEWATRCGLQVQGSHDSSIQVRSVGGDGEGQATGLHFSGNPSKFLQGHNVFGSDDLVALMYDAARAVFRSLDVMPSFQEQRAIRAGEYPLSIVDINYSFELPTRADVRAWIRAAEFKSKTRHGRPQLTGGTLYWGKTSARWTIKVYSKGDEIEARNHKLPEALEKTPVKSWADSKLRVELRMKKKQLIKDGILQAKDLNTEAVKRLFSDYLRKIEMTQQVALTTKKRLELPQRLQSTYILWQTGQDLRSTLPKATYYRHRKDMMAFGIDIALARDVELEDRSNVVPLVRVLEAVPAAIPDWAFAQKLVHLSAR